MSEPVSAMQSAVFEGIAKVQEAGVIGMVTLRGDLASDAVKKAVKTAIDAGMPGQRQTVRSGAFLVAWMSPDELLIVCPHQDADKIVGSLDKSLAGHHMLAVNVSDARAVFDISGAQASDVLAKLMPVDFSAGAFGEKSIRRSRLAQVPAAVWQETNDSFRLVCFRSVAQYAFDVLCQAASPGGEVHA